MAPACGVMCRGSCPRQTRCRTHAGSRQVRPARIEPLEALALARPCATQFVEEVLARAGLQVQQVRPELRRSGVADRPHDLRQRRGRVGEAGDDGGEGDADADPRVGERAHGAQALAGRRRAGLGGARDLRVERRDGEVDHHTRARRRRREHVAVAHDQRAARHDAERVVRFGERLEAGAREAIAALGRLVGIRGRADGDKRARPRAAHEFAPQDLGHVHLHADRGAVERVGRPVGAALEGAHVAERAAVSAAHVGIERPLERHPADAVQGRTAGLLAVFGARHGRQGYRRRLRCTSVQFRSHLTWSR